MRGKLGTVSHRAGYAGCGVLIQLAYRRRRGCAFCIMPGARTKVDTLLRLAKRGPLRARDLEEANIPRAYLRCMLDRGLLEQVDRGLYANTSLAVRIYRCEGRAPSE